MHLYFQSSIWLLLCKWENTVTLIIEVQIFFYIYKDYFIDNPKRLPTVAIAFLFRIAQQ